MVGDRSGEDGSGEEMSGKNRSVGDGSVRNGSVAKKVAADPPSFNWFNVDYAPQSWGIRILFSL